MNKNTTNWDLQIKSATNSYLNQYDIQLLCFQFINYLNSNSQNIKATSTIIFRIHIYLKLCFLDKYIEIAHHISLFVFVGIYTNPFIN